MSASTPIRAASFKDAFAKAAAIEGWLSETQARRLWEAALRVPAGGLLVEIGSFRGRSAVVMASALATGARLVAIDPHAGGDRGPQEIEAEADRGEADHRAFAANMRAAGIESRVELVRLMSSDAHSSVEEAIDVLYVDGAHRFGPARDDIVRWGERVRDGGTMLVHDSFSSIGVTLATLSSVTFRSRWRYVGRTSSLAEYRRERLGVAERTSNSVRQLAQLPWFLRNVIVKVALVTHVRPLARLMGHRGDDWPY
ncbi:MAG TPA: class I SAM-dependent methyltransferase [Thermoleophilaceae bacterium]|nr:class I SAM-dependent methyltransferase [Thermoleophilaceae bacterium]